jgi:class 3 adenylate cyclase
MDDVRAVMDAVGSERSSLFGLSESGPMCMLFASTYPQRLASLVLYGTFARALRAQDYPYGLPGETLARVLDWTERVWGTGAISADHFAPSLADDDAFRTAWARFERLAVSPGGFKTLLRMLHETDARHVLSAIRVPTLVVHRKGDRITPVEGGRYLAEHIAGAKYVELPGDDHFPWVADSDAILSEIEEFLTGMRSGPEPDRVLATVLFTDIVGSTAKAAELGDREWRHLLDKHHVLVREQLTRFRGREIDVTGDGFLAAFDGPARGVRCACAILDAVRSLGLELRAGLHAGECITAGEKLTGIAVHTGARIASLAHASEVLVSRTVKDLVAGSGILFANRGSHVLKGVPGEWQLYAIESA